MSRNADARACFDKTERDGQAAAFAAQSAVYRAEAIPPAFPAAAENIEQRHSAAMGGEHKDMAAEAEAAAIEAEGEADSCPLMFREAARSVEFNKLRKRLLRHMRQAMADFAMLPPETAGQTAAQARPKQKWLIALSGGKDSYGLLALLLDLQWRGLLPAELLACNLDQGQPDFPKNILPDYLTRNGIAHRIEYQDTYAIVTDKLQQSQTYCSLCSRLRRGILYRIAREEGCSAVVLGHHRDDALETFFMNLFHGGRLAAMPGSLRNDEGDLRVLRPLIYAAEEDLAKFSSYMQFPIIPCNLCGSQDGLQRNAMKNMLADMEKRMPGRKETMMRALANIRPSHLLDKKLFDFAALIG